MSSSPAKTLTGSDCPLRVCCAALAAAALLDTAAIHAGTPDANDLFQSKAVPRIQIEVSPEGMKVLENYRQIWGQPRPERQDVRATVRSGNLIFTNVALHLKGSYTFQPIHGKPSLTLNFDKFERGQRFYGLDKVHLNNSVQDPSYVCEKLARETFVEAGVPASRIGHARVALNGRDLGFYVLVEGYNKRFLKQHFQSTRGNLYDGGSGGDIAKALEVDSGEKPDDRSDLTALLAATRLTNPSNRLARLEQLLDVDRFLTFAALEVLFQHWDGYCLGPNNYRLFHDADRDKLIFMPHGMDQLLGVGLSPPSPITPQWDGLVAKALFTIPEGRRRYLQRLGQVFTNHFQAEMLAGKVDQIVQRLRATAGASLVANEQTEGALQSLKSRITRRVAYVRRQLEHPEQPLALNRDGYARLSGWQFRGTRSPMSSRKTRSEDRESLEIHAGGTWAAGSWRLLVLLDEGHYQLTGQARAMGLPEGATNSGVILRVSGERSSSGLTTNATWTPLSYDFDIPGVVNAELVCEFRGAAGAGGFDLSSLKLRRTGPPHPPHATNAPE